MKQALGEKAFTIIEVLVVTAIIMVLASMALVGFTRAQKRAETLQCMNNLRQLGTVIIQYSIHQGGGVLPDFSIRGGRSREQWVWALDYINEEDRYYAVQDQTKILPPRKAPAVLRCPADVQLFVNSQSILTSYWMHPENTYKRLASITNQDTRVVGFEGDALYTTACCGCRFHIARPPNEVSPTHSGGGHVLFLDGTVRYFDDPDERTREALEIMSGWDPEEMKFKFQW